MKIDEKDLDGFASDLVSKCMSTRRERIQTYNGFEHYYLFGCQEGESAPYNKIWPHIDLLTSFLYSQSTVEFEVSVQNEPEPVYEQADLISRRTDMYYHDYGVADAFNEALPLALVFNTELMKLNWVNGGLEPYIVSPHDFGVLDESVTELSRQEAFVHSYSISESELKRRISMLSNGADLMRRVSVVPTQEEDAFPDAVNRLIVAGTVNMTSSTTRGLVNIPDLLGQMVYKPRTIEDKVEMYELWVWDDEKEDYRTITLAAPGVVIYGRKEIGNLFQIKGEQPFVHICPNKLRNYFFGWSEIAGLIKLQDWATERLREIRNILRKQANPPKALSGWGGISDEKIGALDNPGSWISDPTPNAKVEMLSPNMPEDLWQEMLMIQNMFNDESGLSDVLQGKGESGVRSKSHADVLARLGSSRIKKRALAIERTIEDIGSLIVRIMKAKDAHQFTTKTGEKFIAGQFTDDFQVHVDAHSASPVFVDDHIQLAFALAKAQAIDPDSLLELTKPPKVELLRQRFKDMKRQRQAQMQQMAQLGIVPGGKKKQA
ncbi:MAG TPA: hypothetical protein VKP13_09605 [Nitrospira sp.]|nr:hypothetical protein [Nitrospira sp.]